jgi:nicotinamide mononucleotide adenylyltransferase
LDYVLQAFDKADFVFVGLTKIFGSKDSDTSGRESALSNPLKYWERCVLMKAALRDAGVPPSRFEIIPFPIEIPEAIPTFVPLDAVCFTTVVSDWNNEKIYRLQRLGYLVEVLETSPVDNSRVTSGTHIRELIRVGDPSWMRFVPTSVCEAIQQQFLARF